MIIQPFPYPGFKKQTHNTLVTTTIPKPLEFSLLSNFLIGIIEIITDALGDVNADAYLALFTAFIQKYFTLLLRQELKKNKQQQKKPQWKCNLNVAILLRVTGIALSSSFCQTEWQNVVHKFK